MTSDPLSRYLANRAAREDRVGLLRPMTPSEVLDVALRTFQTLGKPILFLAAGPSLVCLLALAFVLEVVLPMFGVTRAPGSVTAQLGEAAFALMLTLCVAAPVFLSGVAYISGGVVKLVSDQMIGSLPSLEAARRTAWEGLRRTLGLALYQVVTGWAGVLISTLLLMISAYLNQVTSEDNLMTAFLSLFAVFGYFAGALLLVIVLGRQALAVPAAIVERRGAMAAARRSAELLAGTAWQPGGYGAVTMLFVALSLLLLLLLAGISATFGLVGAAQAASSTATVPVLGALIGKVVELLPWYLGLCTTIPFWSATVTVLYYERRVRLEGFDIESLQRDILRQDRRSRFEL